MGKNQLTKVIALFLVLFVSHTNSYAQTASIALSESSAQLGYSFLVGGSSYGRTEVGIGAMYNNDDVYLFESSLMVFDQVGSKLPGLVAGLGAKIYGASVGNQEYLVFGVGGKLRYEIPNYQRIVVGFDGYYAPPIVSFLDAERFSEVAVRLAYKMLPKASVFTEYRKYYTESEKGGKGSFEEGFRLGMHISF